MSLILSLVAALLLGSALGVLLQRYTRVPARVKAAVASAPLTLLTRRSRSATTIPGLAKLKRKKYIGATPLTDGETNDQELLDQFQSSAFVEYRSHQLQTHWNYQLDSLDSYLRSVDENRSRLLGYLGRFHKDRRATIAAEETVNVPPNEHVGDMSITRAVIGSRVPNLSFDAYIVKPTIENELNAIGVVALHGHASSAEKLVGLGREDYGRRLALRLAKRGFTVIAPNVASSTPIGNAISAHAALYGYTMYGIMTQFVQSCIDVLSSRDGVNEVGVYGISNGGLISLFASAIDERIDFAVVAGLLTPYYSSVLKDRTSGNSREYFFYFDGPFWTEFDIAQLASMCLPDVLIFCVGQYDDVTYGWETEYDKVLSIYSSLGMRDRIGLVHFDGGHEIPEDLATELLEDKLAMVRGQGRI